MFYTDYLKLKMKPISTLDMDLGQMPPGPDPVCDGLYLSVLEF